MRDFDILRCLHYIYSISYGYKIVKTPSSTPELVNSDITMGKLVSSPNKTMAPQIYAASTKSVLDSIHISLSMISRIICNGMSPSVRMASLLGSGLIKSNVGNPRTWVKDSLGGIIFLVIYYSFVSVNFFF